MSHWSGGPRSVGVRKAVASLLVLQGGSAERTCGTESHPHCLPPSSDLRLLRKMPLTVFHCQWRQSAAPQPADCVGWRGTVERRTHACCQPTAYDHQQHGEAAQSGGRDSTASYSVVPCLHYPLSAGDLRGCLALEGCQGPQGHQELHLLRAPVHWTPPWSQSQSPVGWNHGW